MTHGNSLQNGDLVPNLCMASAAVNQVSFVGWTHHVLSSCHQSLVDNFGSIVPPSINMNALFHN